MSAADAVLLARLIAGKTEPVRVRLAVEARDEAGAVIDPRAVYLDGAAVRAPSTYWAVLTFDGKAVLERGPYREVHAAELRRRDLAKAIEESGLGRRVGGDHG